MPTPTRTVTMRRLWMLPFLLAAAACATGGEPRVSAATLPPCSSAAPGPDWDEYRTARPAQ